MPEIHLKFSVNVPGEYESGLHPKLDSPAEDNGPYNDHRPDSAITVEK